MYQTYIYLMYSTDDKSVLKIGISTDPKARANTLTYKYKRHYKVLSMIKFTTQSEKGARALEALTQYNFLWYNGIKDNAATLDHFIVDARRNKEKFIPLFKKAVSISALTMTAFGPLATLETP